jgi:MFS family permease
MKLRGTHAGLLIGLSLIALVSQFFRSSISVIAPDLIRDLALTPQALGMAGGVFFLALGVAQVPVGMSFDRIGPRLTVAWVSVFAFAGTIWAALAPSGPQLIAARFLVGFGCGASFMSSVVLLLRWYPPDRVATMYGRIFAVSQLGNLLAATPLAWMNDAVGWRAVFGACAVVVVAVVGFFWWAARDWPPGAAEAPPRSERLSRTLLGFVEVLRIPVYKKVVAVHMVAYAAMATVLGLWAGPYLHDVHGLDGVARGNVLLAMGVAQTTGLLVLVPLERRLNTRKRIIVCSALGVIAILSVLAALPHPPLWLAVTLLVALCLVSTYSPLIIAHAANLVPPHLQGRGSAMANIFQVSGSFLLPVVTGEIAGAFERTAAGYPQDAYRWIFAAIALALATGLSIYSRAPDLRPVRARS